MTEDRDVQALVDSAAGALPSGVPNWPLLLRWPIAIFHAPNGKEVTHDSLRGPQIDDVQLLDIGGVSVTGAGGSVDVSLNAEQGISGRIHAGEDVQGYGNISIVTATAVLMRLCI